MVLLHAPDAVANNDIDIHIRTKPRFEYSYIESAAISIGQDTLEIASYGEYWLNGVEGAEMPATMEGFSVTHEQVNKKKHVFKIAMDGSEEAIVVTTFKDLVSVAVENASLANFGSSVGLMGNYGSGSLLARDGSTVMEDHSLFGQEWQVLESERQLFSSPSPYLGQACVPAASTSKGRRLGETIAMDAAEKACAHYEESEKRDMCIFDVMAMGDLEVAEVHGAF